MAEQNYALPMTELLPSARRLLSLHLNPELEIPESGESGYLKDWRGVAELRGFAAIHIRNFALNDDPTGAMFDSWNCHGLAARGETVQSLMDILRQLDRRDVIRALATSLQTSLESWINFMQLAQAPEQVNQISSATGPVDTDAVNDQCDDRLLLGDVPGQPLLIYDALMCYAEEDGPLAWNWTRKLEAEGLKILYMDRDLRPGGNHHTLLAKTIRDRCKTMIFLATHSAVNSPVCDFLVKFAHYLSPGGRDKSLMMIKFFNDVRVPLVLQPLYHLDYSSPHKRQWFWPSLIDYIRTAPPRMEMTREPISRNLGLSLTRQDSFAPGGNQATPTTSDEASSASAPDTHVPTQDGNASQTSREVDQSEAGPSSLGATMGSLAGDYYVGEDEDIPDVRDRGWMMLQSE